MEREKFGQFDIAEDVKITVNEDGGFSVRNIKGDDWGSPTLSFVLDSQGDVGISLWKERSIGMRFCVGGSGGGRNSGFGRLLSEAFRDIGSFKSQEISPVRDSIFPLEEWQFDRNIRVLSSAFNDLTEFRGIRSDDDPETELTVRIKYRDIWLTISSPNNRRIEELEIYFASSGSMNEGVRRVLWKVFNKTRELLDSRVERFGSGEEGGR